MEQISIFISKKQKKNNGLKAQNIRDRPTKQKRMVGFRERNLVPSIYYWQ